jgi:hypothetical protein
MLLKKRKKNNWTCSLVCVIVFLPQNNITKTKKGEPRPARGDIIT